MTNCIFYSIFFTLFLNLSLGSLRYSQINRVFMSIYKGMLEASVITINTEGEPVVPFYNQAKIRSYVVSYLEENISKYSTDYKVLVSFVGLKGKLCKKDCRKVQISLKAEINNFFTYQKTQIFTIEGAKY